MRYLREWTNPQGKQAHAFEDEITDIHVGPRLVTLTSRQGNGQLVVRAQLTRAEVEQVFAVIRHEDEWTRRLMLPPPRADTLPEKIARLFAFKIW